MILNTYRVCAFQNDMDQHGIYCCCCCFYLCSVICIYVMTLLLFILYLFNFSFFLLLLAGALLLLLACYNVVCCCCCCFCRRLHSDSCCSTLNRIGIRAYPFQGLHSHFTQTNKTQSALHNIPTIKRKNLFQMYSNCYIYNM